ncbi:MAG: sodium:alanine symporter family protein [Legionellales bacterium]|nr:sodium:alanine symporter family protein [Legionellales bacterium]
MIQNVIFTIRDVLWSELLLIILISSGLYMTFLLNGIQFRKLIYSFKKYFSTNHEGQGEISSFQALMTALAGAIGTGNIAGISTAIMTGGFGALFWMWVVAFICMAIAYSETLLGLKYKSISDTGEAVGGPMYTLKHGLQSHKIAKAFAFFGLCSSFGYCLVQSNSVVDAIEYVYSANRILFGALLSILTGLVIISGIKRIGKIAAILVPFMTISYLAVGIYILICNYHQILPAFKLIFISAFNGQAAAGGFLGSTITLAIQTGAQYGIFANEAGLGSYAISGASSNNKYPAEQGMLAMSGVFASTMIVCTITGLVLAVTSTLGSYDSTGKILNGAPLVITAFSSVNTNFRYVVMFGLALFAFTTILAWEYYGEKCIEFMFGINAGYFYRWLYLLIVIIGAVLELETVWAIAHLANGLMTLPNLYSIIKLSSVIKKDTLTYANKTSSIQPY